MTYGLRFKVFYALLIILILLFSLSLLYYLKINENSLRVSFLDVGQGDSILIEAPGGQNILIDGGPDDKILSRLGRSLLFWERSIDLIILTHPHSDHVSGLLNIFGRYNIKRILYTDVDYHSSIYKKWEEAINKKDVEVRVAKTPQTIELSENCDLKILYPFHSLQNKEVGDLNNSSLVSKFDCRGTSFLFTGDIEGEVKKELVDSDADLTADVLKLAHHGAGGTVGGRFIENVSPNIAVASVGENDYGHPNEEYLQKLRDRGIKVFRTDRKGTVIFTKEDGRADIEFGAGGIEDIFY